MRFFVDESLSPLIASALREAGQDAVHARELGMAGALDREVFEHARTESRIIISADTDFGTLLATLHAPGPSVILFRGEATDLPARQIAFLKKYLPELRDRLTEGGIAVYDGTRLRIRDLPIP